MTTEVWTALAVGVVLLGWLVIAVAVHMRPEREATALRTTEPTQEASA